MSAFFGNQEAGILLMDKEHRIVYFNDKAHCIFPSLHEGDLCHYTIYGEDMPCRNCPLCAEDGTSVFYNKHIGSWVEASAGRLDGRGQEAYDLILIRPLHGESKSLFFSLASGSDYDELYELNLTAGSYKVLYCQQDKYLVPGPGGSLYSMLKDVAARMIHPDDCEAFLEFWDLSTLLKRMAQRDDAPLQGRFRRKLTNAGWSWVQQTALPVRREENGDQIVMCFVQEIERRLQASEEVEKNPLTGLHHRRKFFSVARLLLQSKKTGNYCLMAIDIEHFKLFNEWYGQGTGDQFLISIGKHLEAAQERFGGVAGYLGNDDFAILLPNNPEVLSDLQNQILSCVNQFGGQAGFQPAFGLYAIEDITAPVQTMYDRASMALASLKGNYVQRVCWYIPAMMEDLQGDHKLLSEIQRALENGEFTFYAQPKCNMATGKIIGLEALVRWNHPNRGVIGPGEFVPLLERNGFISELDQYVWDLVCASVRRWIDSGHRAVPISVNVSRADLYTLDVAECFTGLVEKYGLPPDLIEIEITESAYVENFELISSVVEKLRRAGFHVLMDDFGSGYSSLNMLKDIKLDVLKIDMKFLEMDGQSADRGRGILAAITSMAHMMGLRMIAEGVETREQMEFLLDIGCLYGQGYYFYRPIPAGEFAPLLADENNIDFRGIKAMTIKGLKLKELLNGDQLSEIMVNNILGAAAIYDVSEDGVELLQANQQYCKIVHTNAVDLEEHRQPLTEDVYQGDRKKFLDLFLRARKNAVDGAEEDIRSILADGSSIWMHMRVFFMREQDGHGLYYSAVSDVSQQKQREQQLESSQRALSAVVHLSENDEAFMRLTEENRRIVASIFAQMTPGGMIGGYCEDGFPLYFANHEMIKLLGYNSYEEFAAAIDYKVENTIHPDDRERVANDLGAHYYAGMEYTTTYRMPKKDGNWFWSLDKGRVICAEDGRLAIISACTDISEPMRVQERLAEHNARLLRQNQELAFLNRDMPGGYHRCADTPEFEFTYISDRFLQIFGYTKREIRERFDNKFLNLVHPDDRRLVKEETARIRQGADISSLEYRMLSSRGYIWVEDQSCFMDYGGKQFYQGVIIDVTERVVLYNKLQMLLKNMPEDILLVTLQDGKSRCEAMANGLSRKRGITLEYYQRQLDSGGYEKYITPKELSRLKVNLAAVMEKRHNYRDVVRLIQPDGSPMWSSLEARYIQEVSGKVIYLFLYGDVTALKEKEQELRLSGEQMESILKQAGINSWEWDIPNSRLILCNAVPSKMLATQYPKLGLPKAIVENFPACVKRLLSVPDSSRKDMEALLERMKSGNVQDYYRDDLPVQGSDGETMWLRIAGEVLKDEAGRPVKAVGYYSDVTLLRTRGLQNREEQKALEVLRRQALYDFTINLTRNTLRSSRNLNSWSEETGGRMGQSYSEMVHYLGTNLILPEYQEKFLRFADRERMIEWGTNKGTTERLEYERLYQGAPRWMRMVIHYIQFEDLNDVFAYVFIVDIDKEKRQELELTYLAETDAMTGLYNRRAAIHRIHYYLQEIRGQTSALVIFDLDNFKKANDVFGHAAGDSILLAVANQLKNFFRADDIVCRLGGDEFMVYCQNIRQENIERRLSTIVQEIAFTRSDGEQEFSFTLSAGYAMIPEQGNSFEELYRKADIALFTAKAEGKREYKKYSPSMKEIRYEVNEAE